MDEYSKYYVATPDVDGNDTVDLVTSTGTRLTVYSGQGEFQFAEIENHVGTGLGAKWVSHERVDGDGIADLVGVSTDNQINVYPGVLNTTAVEPTWASGAEAVEIVPSVVGPNAEGCWFAAKGARASEFEVFDLRGRRVTLVTGRAYVGNEVRGLWRLGAGNSRPAAGVYLVRLGDRGPTGRVTILR